MPSDTYFDEATHTYFYDGISVPSVTQILTDLGITGYTDNPHTLPYAERGTRFHHAVTGYFTDHALDPEFFDQLMFVKKVREQFELAATIMEEPMILEGFGGTPDWIGSGVVLNKMAGLIIDWKTGKERQWHHVQLGGYASLYGKVYSEELVYGMIGYVDGETMRPTNLTLMRDLWSSCLDVYQMRRWK